MSAARKINSVLAVSDISNMLKTEMMKYPDLFTGAKVQEEIQATDEALILDIKNRSDLLRESSSNLTTDETPFLALFFNPNKVNDEFFINLCSALRTELQDNPIDNKEIFSFIVSDTLENKSLLISTTKQFESSLDYSLGDEDYERDIKKKSAHILHIIINAIRWCHSAHVETDLELLFPYAEVIESHPNQTVIKHFPAVGLHKVFKHYQQIFPDAKFDDTTATIPAFPADTASIRSKQIKKLMKYHWQHFKITLMQFFGDAYDITLKGTSIELRFKPDISDGTKNIFEMFLHNILKDLKIHRTQHLAYVSITSFSRFNYNNFVKAVTARLQQELAKSPINLFMITLGNPYRRKPNNTELNQITPPNLFQQILRLNNTLSINAAQLAKFVAFAVKPRFETQHGEFNPIYCDWVNQLIKAYEQDSSESNHLYDFTENFRIYAEIANTLKEKVTSNILPEEHSLSIARALLRGIPVIGNIFVRFDNILDLADDTILSQNIINYVTRLAQSTKTLDQQLAELATLAELFELAANNSEFPIFKREIFRFILKDDFDNTLNALREAGLAIVRAKFNEQQQNNTQALLAEFKKYKTMPLFNLHRITSFTETAAVQEIEHYIQSLNELLNKQHSFGRRALSLPQQSLTGENLAEPSEPSSQVTQISTQGFKDTLQEFFGDTCKITLDYNPTDDINKYVGELKENTEASNAIDQKTFGKPRNNTLVIQHQESDAQWRLLKIHVLREIFTELKMKFLQGYETIWVGSFEIFNYDGFVSALNTQLEKLLNENISDFFKLVLLSSRSLYHLDSKQYQTHYSNLFQQILRLKKINRAPKISVEQLAQLVKLTIDNPCTFGQHYSPYALFDAMSQLIIAYEEDHENNLAYSEGTFPAATLLEKFKYYQSNADRLQIEISRENVDEAQARPLARALLRNLGGIGNIFARFDNVLRLADEKVLSANIINYVKELRSSTIPLDIQLTELSLLASFLEQTATVSGFPVFSRDLLGFFIADPFEETLKALREAGLEIVTIKFAGRSTLNAAEKSNLVTQLTFLKNSPLFDLHRSIAIDKDTKAAKKIDGFIKELCKNSFSMYPSGNSIASVATSSERQNERPSSP